MNQRQAARLGWTLLLGVLYGWLSSLTLGLSLPGSSADVAVRPQVVIPLLGGFLMGPLHGFVIGCGGNFLADWLTGFGLAYWPFSIGNGLIGFLPGLLHLRGVRRLDNVAHFAMLLVLIVAGNVLGIGVGMVAYQATGGESLHHLTWTFFHPIIVANIVLGFILLPPLLLLFRKISSTFDIRLGVSLMYVLMSVVLAMIFVLNLINNHTILAELAGVLPEEKLAAYMEAVALNSFRFGGSMGIAVILVSVGMTFGLIQHQARPVRALMQAARELKEGQFDQIDLGSLARKQDEFGRLAQVFEEAVGQVREREGRMKQAIQELRLEIDRDQEARQVSEITETDYFHSLRRRSLELRAKKEKQRHEKNRHKPGPERTD